MPKTANTQKAQILPIHDASKGGNTVSTDPVVNYMREIMKLYPVEQALENTRFAKNDEWKENYYQDSAKDIYAKVDALEQMVCTTQANSTEGCLAQIALLQYQISMIDGYEMDQDEISKHAKVCTRLLHSIKDAMLKNSAIAPDELGVNKYMGEHMNPWLTADQRIARVESETA